MNGKAADIGKLLNPSPELPTYDPAWETRWDQANSLLTLAGKHDPRGASELTRRLGKELRDATFAWFRFACDLKEQLALKSAALKDQVRALVSHLHTGVDFGPWCDRAHDKEGYLDHLREELKSWAARNGSADDPRLTGVYVE